MINNCNHLLMLLTYLVNLTSRFTSDHSISSCLKAWYSLEFEGQTRFIRSNAGAVRGPCIPCDGFGWTMMNHDFNQKLDGFSSMLEDGFPLMKGG